MRPRKVQITTRFLTPASMLTRERNTSYMPFGLYLF